MTGFQLRGVPPLGLARVLIALQLVALTVSTAATSVVEILIYLVFLSSGPLRKRVLAALAQPMVVMTLVFWAMIGVRILDSTAPLPEALSLWGSWRKCLIVPLAAAVYDDPVWKKGFAWTFISLMALAALLSFAGHLYGITFHSRLPVGILVGNWATQSMFFATAAFICLVFIRFFPGKSAILLWPMALVITANLIFVTWGRSGYLAFAVYLALLVFWGAKGRIRNWLLLAVPVLLLLVLALSPVANTIIAKGFKEIRTHDSDTEKTSMGLRIVFWKNTLAILRTTAHPWVGFGTGAFKTSYADAMEKRDGWQGEPSSDPHNQYLHILVEYGLTGLLLFLGLVTSFFCQASPRPFYYLGIGVLLAWCATSLLNGHFSTFHEGRFVFLWCAAMLSPGKPPVNPVACAPGP